MREYVGFFSSLLSDDTDSCDEISEQIVNRMIGAAMDDWQNRAQH